MSVYNKPDISKINNYISPYFNSNDYSNTNIIDTTFSNLHVQNELTLTNPIYYPLYAPISYTEGQIGYKISASLYTPFLDPSNNQHLLIKDTNTNLLSNELILPCYGVWLIEGSIYLQSNDPTTNDIMYLFNLGIAQFQGSSIGGLPNPIPNSYKNYVRYYPMSANNANDLLNISYIHSPETSNDLNLGLYFGLNHPYMDTTTTPTTYYTFITYPAKNGVFSNNIITATRIA